MQAAARKVKGAEGVSRCRLAGRIPAWYRFRPAGWRSKGTYRVKTQASAAIICDPVFAEDCTGKQLNRPVKALLSGCEALGAVNDSIGQGGDYGSAAGAERKNCFCVKKVFVNRCYRASLAFSRPSDGKVIRRSGRRFSNVQACDSGKARFALAQYPVLRRLAFHLWASALSARLPAWRMPALSCGKRQKATFHAFSAPQ